MVLKRALVSSQHVIICRRLMLKSAQIWKGLLHHRREQWVMEPEPKPDCWVLGSTQVTELVCFPKFNSQSFFFWCGPFLKSLLNLLQYYFCFMFWFFGHKACGILASQPGIEHKPSALKGKVLKPLNLDRSPSIDNWLWFGKAPSLQFRRWVGRM